MSHRPRKRFGQNFLQSRAIIEQILAALQLQAQDKVVEIGPGMGALTEGLLRYLNKLNAIEIDRDLQDHLKGSFGSDRLMLIADDALQVDYRRFGHELRIVGNLPYNIASPLMLHLLKFADKILDMHFMVQKEVALRLAASPGTRDYGRLTVMIQYHCEVNYLFDVPPESFYPKPRVDSAVVRIKPYRERPYPEVSTIALENLLRQAFSMRRKTLANNLKPLLSAAELEHLGIESSLRPEQISISDFVALAKFFI